MSNSWIKVKKTRREQRDGRHRKQVADGGPGNLAGNDQVAEGQRSDYLQAGEIDRVDHGYDSPGKALQDHPAVKYHGLGTSSQDLASFVECFSSFAMGRVTGTGDDQYGLASSGLVAPAQKFERDTLATLVDESLEELADLINYAAMLAIKLVALRGRFVP